MGGSKSKPNEGCIICLEELSAEKCIKLPCRHKIHKPCFDSLIEAAKDPDYTKVSLPKCPYSNCQKPMPMKFLAGMRVVDAFLPAALDDLHTCQGPDCGLLFQWDACSLCQEFKCPSCKGLYCIKCKLLWSKHPKNGNCPTENDEAMIAAKKYRQCMECGVWLERDGGCPYVTVRLD